MAGWEDVSASIAAMCSSCTSASGRIPRRSIPRRARCSSGGRRRGRRAGDPAESEIPVRVAVSAVNLAQAIRPLTATWPRSSIRSARSLRRSHAAAGTSRHHGRAPAADPCKSRLVAARGTGVEHARPRRRPAPGLLLHDRVRLCAGVRARRAAVAAPRRGGRALPRPRRSDQSARAARSADPGRSVRAVLHRTFPGKTRFSIEGLDMLVRSSTR